MKRLALACMLAVGCSSDFVDQPIAAAPDAQQEAGAETSPDVTSEIAPDVAPDAQPDMQQEASADVVSELPAAPDAAEDHAPDAFDALSDPISEPVVDVGSEPAVCDLKKLGEGCFHNDVQWRDCCPGLVCSSGTCLDPGAGVDGATACPCNCSKAWYPDGGLYTDCVHGGCGCSQEGDTQLVQAVGLETPAMCPALWISYGPYGGCNTVWMPVRQGNQIGGYCKGHENAIVQCAPCFAWKPC